MRVSAISSRSVADMVADAEKQRTWPMRRCGGGAAVAEAADWPTRTASGNASARISRSTFRDSLTESELHRRGQVVRTTPRRRSRGSLARHEPCRRPRRAPERHDHLERSGSAHTNSRNELPRDQVAELLAQLLRGVRSGVVGESAEAVRDSRPRPRPDGDRTSAARRRFRVSKCLEPRPDAGAAEP